MGSLTTFLKVLKEPYWLARQQFFWNSGHAPNRSTSLDPQLQSRNKCAYEHLNFLVYIKGSWTLGKLCGIKPRCHWEHLGECISEHFRNLMGTHWEQRRKPKTPCGPPPRAQKEKHWIVHECMRSLLTGCMKFLFPKLLVTIFHLG
jgi:hypothetical protein